MGVIFNTKNESDHIMVAESKYGVGLNAALMHVYENETNYTAMMKSVGLSELKYCTENAGKDLFLNEAGAFKGFVDKVIAFFKKIIEKIQAIFNAFMAKINSYILSDREFFKKYKKEIQDKDISGLKFKGKEILFDAKTFDSRITTDLISSTNDIDNKWLNTDSNSENTEPSFNRNEVDTDAEEIKDTFRGVLAGQGGDKLTESEFRDAVIKKFNGEEDKKEFDVTKDHVTKALEVVESSKLLITSAKEVKDHLIKEINAFIKELTRQQKNPDELMKKVPNKNKSEESKNKAVDIAQKIISIKIDIAKSASNAYTIYFGALIGALKDANRQSKALCVKVLTYKNDKKEAKNESATAYAESGVPFADVKLV